MEQYIPKSALMAEILKRREINKKNKLNLAAAFEDNYLLSFLDDLEVKEVEEEHTNRTPADIAPAMQEVEEKSRAFTEAHQGESSDEILAQMRGEKPVSEDLEEAARSIRDKLYLEEGKRDEFGNPYFLQNTILKAVIMGAKWQKEQDQSAIELAEDHAMLVGMEKMKEQMMKDAVDMVVGYWMPNGLMLATDESENCYNIDDGDKVKVIVIKENQL